MNIQKRQSLHDKSKKSISKYSQNHTHPAHYGGYRRKEIILKKRIKNMLIRLSAAGAFITLLAAGSTIGSPDFTWHKLPALIGIMAGSGIWLSLVGYANQPKRKRHPPLAHGKVSGHKKHSQLYFSTFCAGKEGKNADSKSING